MRNANKTTLSKSLKNALIHNGEKTGKVIWNPYLGPDHHEKLTSSSDW